MPRRAHQPRARVRGYPCCGPLLQRRDKGFLYHLLSEIEVAQEADQGGENTPRLFAIEMLEIHSAAQWEEAYHTRQPSTAQLLLVHHDRPHLDRPIAGRRDANSERDRLIEIFCFDQVVAAELFAGFGERA